jgi:hypothetical protein
MGHGGYAPFELDTDLMRFDGEISGKMFMADITMCGGCELLGMTSLTAPQGAT